MKRRQTGFTMIELIVVIVILGILAAAALPKFVDMKTDAQLATAKGVAGAAASAMSLNYSGCLVKNNVVTTGVCAKVSACTDVSSLLQGGLDPQATITVATLGTVNGGTATCTVTVGGTGGQTATFTGIAAGN